MYEAGVLARRSGKRPGIDCHRGRSAGVLVLHRQSNVGVNRVIDAVIDRIQYGRFRNEGGDPVGSAIESHVITAVTRVEEIQ